MSLLIAFAAVAAVQQPLGPHRHFPALPLPSGRASPLVEKGWQNESGPKVRKAEQRFAECIVKKNQQRAARFVLAESAQARSKLVAKVTDGNCLVKAMATEDFGSVRMSFDGDTMQYALADALVRIEFGSTPLTDLAAVPSLEHEQVNPAMFTPLPGKKLKPGESQALEQRKVVAKVYAYLAEFGECVVRADPANAYRLLMTNPESPGERASFAALSHALRTCVEEDQTLAFNKATVRGTVAYNYYRLAKAPRAVVAGEPK